MHNVTLNSDMSANQSASLLHRLRRLKAALLAVSFTLAGILLMMLNAWLAPLQLGDWQWLHALPLGELGGTLFGAGLLSTFFEYAFRRDQERAVTERFRQTIRDEAPALRDAVIEAFRFDRHDVARIATPELLDDLARTSLGLRFGDPAFGREVYADIRHQAMAAEERWYDARVDATLGIPRGRSSAPTPFFDLRVRWEYTVTPRHRFRKFAVVSDRQRYDQLVAERGETSVWYRRPVPGLAVSDPRGLRPGTVHRQRHASAVHAAGGGCRADLCRRPRYRGHHRRQASRHRLPVPFTGATQRSCLPSQHRPPDQGPGRGAVLRHRHDRASSPDGLRITWRWRTRLRGTAGSNRALPLRRLALPESRARLRLDAPQ